MVERLPDGRFPKGTSGNPQGRPRSSVRKVMRSFMEARDSNDRGRILALAEEAYLIATDRSEKARDRLAAIAWITDQLDGRLPTRLSAESDEAGGIIIRFADAQPPDGR